MKILIIKLGAIGDVLRTASALPALKEKYRESEIYWLTKKSSLDLLENNRYLNKVYTLNKDHEELNNIQFDLIINLDDEDIACELASKIKSKNLVGAYIDNNNTKTYSEDSAPWFDMGLISKYGKIKADELKVKNKDTYQKYLYDMLGLDTAKIHEPILNLTNEYLDFANKFAFTNNIQKTDLVIGINTGAGRRWKDKKLDIKKTEHLIRKLDEQLDCKIILFGGPAELERNERILHLSGVDIIDAGTENSLLEFASLVNLCDILVCSDSLALHIGVALKKKIVAFFGPTPSAEIMLFGRGIKIAPDYECRCCYKRECDPKPDYDVDEILDAVIKLTK